MERLPWHTGTGAVRTTSGTGEQVRELHVVAVSEDGRHVLLAGKRGATKGGFRVALDDRLSAAVRGDLPRPGEDEPHSSELTPKEIQARLRMGESAEAIALAAGVPVGRVERFSGPVQGEMARMIDAARSAFLVRGRLGTSAVPLGVAVDNAIAHAPSLRPDSTDWSTRRDEDGCWLVTVTWFARKRSREASWRYDPSTKTVTAVDPASAALAHVDPDAPAHPTRRRAPAAAARPERAARRPAKPAAAKKAAGKKAPAKQAPAKKAAAKKAPAKKAPARKAPAKKAPARKATARTATARKAPARKAPARKAPASKAPASKAAARRAPAREATAARGRATKVPARKAPAKKATAGTAPAREAKAAQGRATKAPAKKAPARKAAATRAPAVKAVSRTVTPKQAARVLRVVPDPTPPARKTAAERDGVKTRATVPAWADVLLGTSPGGDR